MRLGEKISEMWESVEKRLSFLLWVILALRVLDFLMTFVIGRIYPVVAPSELLTALISVAVFFLFMKWIKEGRRWVLILLFLGSIFSVIDSFGMMGVFDFWSELPAAVRLISVWTLFMIYLNLIIFFYLVFSNQISRYMLERKKERLLRELEK